MADRRILVPLADGRWLSLDKETFAAALAAGAEQMAAPSPAAAPAAPLFVDAAEMGRLTDTGASWWESAARDLDCPSVFVGRVRRFKVADCLVWLESVQERDGNGHARRCGAAPRART
jgi:hypothetical protein